MHDFFPCHSADVTTNAPKWAHYLQQLVSPLASPVWTWDNIPSRMWATCLFCPLLCPHLLEESLSSLGTEYFWINEHMNIINFHPPSLWQSLNSRCFYSLSGSLLSFLCFLSSSHCHYFLPEECVHNLLTDGSFISWVGITVPFLCLEHTSGPLVPEFLALNLNSLWPSMCLICSIIFCYSLQNFIFCLVKLTIFLSSTFSQSAIPIHLGSGDSQNSDCSALELGKFQENQDHSNISSLCVFSPQVTFSWKSMSSLLCLNCTGPLKSCQAVFK